VRLEETSAFVTSSIVTEEGAFVKRKRRKATRLLGGRALAGGLGRMKGRSARRASILSFGTRVVKLVIEELTVTFEFELPLGIKFFHVVHPVGKRSTDGRINVGSEDAEV
jgi:hypothetical protein